MPRRKSGFCSRLCGSRKDIRQRQLFIFDFDRTIVTRDSDPIFKDLLAERRNVPTNEKSLNFEFNWKQRGQNLIDHVIAHGVKPDTILEGAAKLDTVLEIEQPLARIQKFLNKHADSRLLVLSNTSNDLFIDARLTNLKPAIHANVIIASHAEISASRHHILLSETPNPDPLCPLCGGGFCKGTALVDFMDANDPFERSHFVCDGAADLCPALRLSRRDYVYVRAGEVLDEIIRTGAFRGFDIKLRANVKRWSTGLDLLEEFKQSAFKQRPSL